MKRKIAFISEHASPLAMLGGVDSGGQNVYVGELAKGLSNIYDIDIYTRWDNPQLPRVVQWQKGIRIIHVKAGPVSIIPKEELVSYMPAFTADMLTFIHQEGLTYKLVHANFFMSGMVAVELKKILNIPFVITFYALGYVRQLHQGKNDKFPPERIDIEKQIVKYADSIIAECPQDKKDLVDYYHAPAEKIRIIPCGFNPDEFYPMDKAAARSFLGLNQNDKILLQLGRMVPRKGVDNVIEALSKVNNNEDYKLIVVGGEQTKENEELCPEVRRLQKIAQQAGVERQVIFTGRKDRSLLKYYYAAADVFITTPWYEPFGITPLEAMACGTPVIGARVGGIKYSITDGDTGFLVPPRNPAELALKMEELLNTPGLIEQMRSRCLDRVNSLFTWKKVASMVADLYTQFNVPAIIAAPLQPSIKNKPKAA